MYMYNDTGTIKDLFEIKIAQVAMLIILTLLTLCCGFQIIRGQHSQRRRISQGKPTLFFAARSVEHIHEMDKYHELVYLL